jgi:hypothetical protein
VIVNTWPNRAKAPGVWAEAVNEVLIGLRGDPLEWSDSVHGSTSSPRTESRQQPTVLSPSKRLSLSKGGCPFALSLSKGERDFESSEQVRRAVIASAAKQSSASALTPTKEKRKSLDALRG